MENPAVYRFTSFCSPSRFFFFFTKICFEFFLLFESPDEPFGVRVFSGTGLLDELLDAPQDSLVALLWTCWLLLLWTCESWTEPRQHMDSISSRRPASCPISIPVPLF